MKTLFTTMEEVIKYVTVDISSNFRTIHPYLFEAHKFVLKGMDKVTFKALLDYVEAGASGDSIQDNLLDYTRRTLANFAYAVSAKRLGVFIGENGIMEFGNQNLDPLSPERLDQVKSEFFSSGFNALENQILFIQENKENYADAYSFLFDNTFFVSTAEQLNKLIFTDIQNRDYFEMKKDLFLIEQDIEGIITSKRVTEIKTAAAEGSLADDNLKMYDYIMPAEACLAFGAKFKSEKHEEKGRALLEQLRTYYTTLTETTIERWDNEDKTLFAFG